MSGLRITGLTAAASVDSDFEFPVDHADFASAKRATAAMLGVLVAKMAYVNGGNGDDSTGLIGYRSRPFLTLNAVQTAAASGYEIEVFPGSYVLTAPLGKNGVNWLFHAGVTITPAAGQSAFSATSAMTFSVRGPVTINGLTTFPAVFVNHASANVNIDGATITGAGAGGTGTQCAAGILTVRRSILSSASAAESGYGAVISGGGTQTIQDCTIKNTNATAGEPIFAEADGLTLWNCVVVASGGADRIGITGGVSVKVYGHNMANTAVAGGVTLIGGGTYTVNVNVTIP